MSSDTAEGAWGERCGRTARPKECQRQRYSPTFARKIHDPQITTERFNHSLCEGERQLLPDGARGCATGSGAFECKGYLPSGRTQDERTKTDCATWCRRFKNVIQRLGNSSTKPGTIGEDELGNLRIGRGLKGDVALRCLELVYRTVTGEPGPEGENSRAGVCLPQTP